MTDIFSTNNDVFETSTDKKGNITVNPNPEGKIVTTFKAGGGYDAPWIVVHAESVEESIGIMRSPQISELMSLVQQGAKQFAEGWEGAPAKPRYQGGGSSAPRQQGKPEAATQAPNGETKQCDHGEMVFRSGRSAKGPWQGFFCPLPKEQKDQQCKPQFIR